MIFTAGISLDKRKKRTKLNNQYSSGHINVPKAQLQSSRFPFNVRPFLAVNEAKVD